MRRAGGGLATRLRPLFDQFHPRSHRRIVLRPTITEQIDHVTAGPFLAMADGTFPDAATEKQAAFGGTFHGAVPLVFLDILEVGCAAVIALGWLLVDAAQVRGPTRPAAPDEAGQVLCGIVFNDRLACCVFRVVHS